MAVNTQNQTCDCVDNGIYRLPMCRRLYHALRYTIRMTNEILASIDSEISVLKQARALLTGTNNGARAVGRPKKRKFTMSAEGRAKIAAAQRARWAKQKEGGEVIKRLQIWGIENQSSTRALQLKAPCPLQVNVTVPAPLVPTTPPFGTCDATPGPVM